MSIYIHGHPPIDPIKLSLPPPFCLLLRLLAPLPLIQERHTRGNLIFDLAFVGAAPDPKQTVFAPVPPPAVVTKKKKAQIKTDGDMERLNVNASEHTYGPVTMYM